MKHCSDRKCAFLTVVLTTEVGGKQLSQYLIEQKSSKLEDLKDVWSLESPWSSTQTHRIGTMGIVPNNLYPYTFNSSTNKSNYNPDSFYF